ncbi:hypothetical protein QNH20_12820 [Neobacillus sp. WH10]|uniref:hypothetical protein n=1 Tax=Neobacillus sp. WH10 TaxID=3047873 RepID=UPI0024C1FFE0|nr:hypothetical protein [Neobacillus sp. WH10]WHY79964.1 hypothetical protein QNH20_12820 [Neobacillus sp. WH10]
MKNDIKINYGILDGIIEQLHVYKNALNTMHSSLAKISVFIAENQGESIDAWEGKIQDSQNYIKDYQEQMNDLLSLFENYVGETTAYISPLARHAMMRVDRNDIWFNLQQMETGILNNLPKAYLTANREPFPTFFLSDEEKEREIEKSRSNQAKLQMISREIQSSQRSLDNKMEQLWRLYDSKVKKFEIVDDHYQVKALKMKYKYTSIFEGMWDAIEDMSKDVFDLLRGVAVGLYSIVTGLATLVIDAGIVAVSSVIPDTIEPDFINKAANKRIDQYTEALVEAIKDPIGVVESVSQSISDTYEEEGIMYVTGSTASSFIPIVGMATKLSKISKLTSKTPDSKPKPVSDTIKAKVDDLVKNNKAFEGIKKGTLEFVKGVKGGAVIFMDGIVGGMKKMVNPDHNIAYSTSGTLPWKVTNPKIVQDRIEDVASQFAVKGTGEALGNKKVAVGEEIIAQRVLKAELDLTPKLTPYKSLSRDQQKIIKEKIENRTVTKEEYKRYQWDKRFSKRRAAGVNEFWKQEKKRILDGEPPTREWTNEQIQEILKGKKPQYNGQSIIGHHTYNAMNYPHICNIGELIYPVTSREHLKGWHGGSYSKNAPGRPVDPNYLEEF